MLPFRAHPFGDPIGPSAPDAPVGVTLLELGEADALRAPVPLVLLEPPPELEPDGDVDELDPPEEPDPAPVDPPDDPPDPPPAEPPDDPDAVPDDDPAPAPGDDGADVDWLPPLTPADAAG